MQRTRATALAPVVLLTLAIAAGPALAGKVETGEPQGSTPMPNEGKEVEISFNPTVRVTVLQGETIQEVFDRLAQEARDASTGFDVNTDTGAAEPPYTVEIRRAGGTEINQLSFRENDPALQINAVSVDYPGLVAKIGRMSEEPLGGMILVRLNQTVIPVTTSPSQDRVLLDQELLAAIRAAGFQAHLEPAYLVVEKDLGSDETMTVVGLSIDDEGIESSVLALGPPGFASDAEAIPSLSVQGVAVMTTLLLLAGLLFLRRRGLAARPLRRR